MKIIDYQIQQYRIAKQLAMAYAIKLTGNWMIRKVEDFQGGNHGTLDLDLLPEMAALSGGLKALCTYWAWQGIEDCRKCCGGNGYLLNSGIAMGAADYVWQITAEGDYILLTLQTARYLLKSVKAVWDGGKPGRLVAYLDTDA
ncbi:acyl-Coenzyme A oxidase, partial [Quaeritorhiza haematococci]